MAGVGQRGQIARSVADHVRGAALETRGVEDGVGVAARHAAVVLPRQVRGVADVGERMEPQRGVAHAREEGPVHQRDVESRQFGRHLDHRQFGQFVLQRRAALARFLEQMVDARIGDVEQRSRAEGLAARQADFDAGRSFLDRLDAGVQPHLHARRLEPLGHPVAEHSMVEGRLAALEHLLDHVGVEQRLVADRGGGDGGAQLAEHPLEAARADLGAVPRDGVEHRAFLAHRVGEVGHEAAVQHHRLDRGQRRAGVVEAGVDARLIDPRGAPQQRVARLDERDPVRHRGEEQRQRAAVEAAADDQVIGVSAGRHR